MNEIEDAGRAVLDAVQGEDLYGLYRAARVLMDDRDIYAETVAALGYDPQSVDKVP